jgi:LacI family transcriptional regulator
MAKRATLIEIAEAAGVSISTVDRVINGRGGVRADKERLVLDWAMKLDLGRTIDYRPHRAMRIAVLMQDPSNPFYAAPSAAPIGSIRISTYSASSIISTWPRRHAWPR